MTRLGGKRPDGLTLIPWQGGKPSTWDVTVVCTLAASYLSSSARSAGAAADLAVSRRGKIYGSYQFVIFSPLPMNPTVEFKCPLVLHQIMETLEWYLQKLARDIVPLSETLGHHTTFQFPTDIREFLFCRRYRTRPPCIPTFDF